MFVLALAVLVVFAAFATFVAILKPPFGFVVVFTKRYDTPSAEASGK
jgi:hypothetical protein